MNFDELARAIRLAWVFDGLALSFKSCDPDTIRRWRLLDMIACFDAKGKYSADRRYMTSIGARWGYDRNTLEYHWHNRVRATLR